MQILKSRIEKIMKLSIFQNKTDVRTFLEIIELTHKWVSNFSEINRSLIRLIEKVNWRWIASEQLTFEILKIKCTISACMHEYDYSLSTHFYTNASLYERDLMIIQFQIIDEKIIKVSILYDFIIFNLIERRYSIYKKKLCALIKFVSKYDYFCKHLKNVTVIHTDHKSLIWFLRSNAQKRIYDHWTNKLKRLNLKIQYISNRRNQIANELFRTIFQNENFFFNDAVHQIIDVIDKDFKWIWKNEKREYQNFLKNLEFMKKQKILDQETLKKENVFARVLATAVDDEVSSEDLTSWNYAYRSSNWFEIIYRIWTDDSSHSVSLKSENFVSVMNYRMKNEILWKYHRLAYLSCIFESKVLEVLRAAHDNSDH